jgi:hypothetical protein
MKQNINLVRVRLLTDGYFRDSDNLKCWLKPRTFPVIVKAEIIYSGDDTPVFAKVPMEELVAIGMNPAIFEGLEMCGLSWQIYDDGEPEAEIV